MWLPKAEIPGYITEEKMEHDLIDRKIKFKNVSKLEKILTKKFKKNLGWILTKELNVVKVNWMKNILILILKKKTKKEDEDEPEFISYTFTPTL